MARMIPDEIGYFDKKSGENELFYALEKLPNDYYVFHSYRINLFTEQGLHEGEADFLIFNPKYGVLLIEAKNGKVYCDNGCWYYHDGTKMKDPFNQSIGAMYTLKKKLNETFPQYSTEINKCKFLNAVWFPSYTANEINYIGLGPNVVKELILTKDDLNNPTTGIERIMETIQKMHLIFGEAKYITNANGYAHGLDFQTSMHLFERVLCPSFDIVANGKKEFADYKYIKLLEEQCIILDFLSNQKSAAIAGASGTGKTLVALERAKRVSNCDNRVLYLCYNSNLKDYLDKLYSSEFVDFYNVDGYSCKLCKGKIDYQQLNKVIEEKIISNTFEYKHIIVDEGQDFGRKEIEDSGLLETLADYGNNTDGASFFIFYDKNQMVNSKNLPSYIQDVDSKLTLYKNCRNTKNIAGTAYSLIDIKPKMNECAFEGDLVKFIYYTSTEELEKRVDNIIETLSKDKCFEYVLLTCKGMNSNSLVKSYNDKTGNYTTLSGKKVKLFSTSTFKGLETDDVLLFDVDAHVFEENNFAFYVGATRAKHNLYVFINMSDFEIDYACDKRLSGCMKFTNKKKQLALAMHGVPQ